MVDRSRRGLFTRRNRVNTQRLPWVVDENKFIDACSRCNRCIDACETDVIIKGDGGFPEVDFNQGQGECTFCYQCASGCPESLFLPEETKPWDSVALINDTCIALKNIECRSCGDMCESQAIGFELQRGKVGLPRITIADCSGCGACQSGCPVSAITLKNSALDT